MELKNEQDVREQAHLDGARIRRAQPNSDYVTVEHLAVEEGAKHLFSAAHISAYQEGFFEGYSAPQRVTLVTVSAIASGRPYTLGSKRMEGTWLEAERWGQECAGTDETASIEEGAPLHNLLLPGLTWKDGVWVPTIIS